MTQLSIVVPVYKAGSTLRELYRRIRDALVPLGLEFEVILVEDGGMDDSWDVIRELSQSDHRIKGIQHSRNFGQHNALLTGIRAARYDIVATLDDDLQNPPEEIPRLLRYLAQGYDVVYGTPQREQHGFFRDAASQITKFALQSAMGAETARKVSAFRVFRTRLREAFADYQNPYVSIDVLLTWGTTSFAACEVKHDPRTAGISNYNLAKLIRHAMNMITGFSVLPLQLASLVGFALTLLGMGLLAYVLIGYLVHGSTVSGFPFLASVLAFFSGAQMFALGIIGEYLARMHLRSMGRPAAVVRERVGGTDGASPVKAERLVGVSTAPIALTPDAQP